MQRAKPVTKPSKQRKMLYQAPDHVRHRLLAAHLSPQLRATHIAKSLPVRSGDTVRVMRGDHKGFEGKISRVDLKKYRIYVEGLSREKADGTTIFVPIHPSKVLVTHLDLDDKWRKKILDRKKEAHKKPKKIREKPKAKLEEKPPELVEKEIAREEKAIVEEKPRAEEKPVIQKKPAKKRVARAKRKTMKETVAEKVETKAEAEEPKKPKQRKLKTERKTAKRKTARKTKEGEE